jgi:hypothetical protein
MTSIWTRQELLEQIAACKKALLAAYKYKSAGTGSVNKTNQDIAALRAELSRLQAELAALSGTGFPRIVYARVAR